MTPTPGRLAQLSAGHRRGLHRDDLDERARRDHHPARVLAHVPREARDLATELRERAPARRCEPALDVGEQLQLFGDALRMPAVGDPREPTPAFIRDALVAGIAELSSYPRATGLPELRAAIAAGYC